MWSLYTCFYVHHIKLGILKRDLGEKVFFLQSEKAYLEYELFDSTRVILVFETINDRDGCYISLDMYKAQLGPVTEEVLTRILNKFNGRIVTPSS